MTLRSVREDTPYPGASGSELGSPEPCSDRRYLIVLDEPNANLNSAGENALMEAIRSLKEQRTTVIFVTHKTNMLSLADKVLVLDKGVVRLFGERDEVLAKIFGGPRVVASTTQPASPLAAATPIARG